MTGRPGPVVLDSSAILALLKREPGAASVAEVLGQGLMSSINWAETVAVCYRQRLSEQALRHLLVRGLRVEPLSHEQADIAGGLQLNVGRLGLSLADCCCLALAVDFDAPVLTADADWSDLDQDIDVRLLR